MDFVLFERILHSKDFNFHGREESCIHLPPIGNQDPIYCGQSILVLSFPQGNLSHQTIKYWSFLSPSQDLIIAQMDKFQIQAMKNSESIPQLQDGRTIPREFPRGGL